MGLALELKQEIDKVIQLKLIAESNIIFSEIWKHWNKLLFKYKCKELNKIYSTVSKFSIEYYII